MVKMDFTDMVPTRNFLKTKSESFQDFMQGFGVPKGSSEAFSANFSCLIIYSISGRFSSEKGLFLRLFQIDRFRQVRTTKEVIGFRFGPETKQGLRFSAFLKNKFTKLSIGLKGQNLERSFGGLNV